MSIALLMARMGEVYLRNYAASRGSWAGHLQGIEQVDTSPTFAA